MGAWSEVHPGGMAFLGLLAESMLDIYICVYIHIYIYDTPETPILYDFTTKNTVSCCFCMRNITRIGPDFA